MKPFDQDALDAASREVRMMLLREGSNWGTKACEEMGRIFMVAYHKASPSPSEAEETERYREALREIALMGMTVPMEMGEPNADWYKSRAYKAISTAAWALNPSTDTSGKEGGTMIELPRLHNEFIGIVARGLHYFENFEVVNQMRSAADVKEALEGGIARYKTDPAFKAKVHSLVAQLMLAVSSAPIESTARGKER